MKRDLFVRKLSSVRKRTLTLMHVSPRGGHTPEELQGRVEIEDVEIGRNVCRNCGQRFYRPTEGGLPACPEGAIHVAEEVDDGRR